MPEHRLVAAGMPPRRRRRCGRRPDLARRRRPARRRPSGWRAVRRNTTMRRAVPGHRQLVRLAAGRRDADRVRGDSPPWSARRPGPAARRGRRCARRRRGRPRGRAAARKAAPPSVTANSPAASSVTRNRTEPRARRNQLARCTRESRIASVVDQAIAERAHRLQAVAGERAVDLGAEVADVDLDDVVVALEVEPPHLARATRPSCATPPSRRASATSSVQLPGGQHELARARASSAACPGRRAGRRWRSRRRARSSPAGSAPAAGPRARRS